MYDPIVGGQHIERFLSDSIVQEIFREQKMLYFDRWVKSNDPSDRELIFAECRAFDRLSVALRAVADAGLMQEAQPELERRSQ